MCSASSQAIGEGMDAITRSNSSASNLGGVLDQVIASLSLTGKPKSPSSLELEVVRWGRSAYSNIQKFNKFLLVVNVTALTMNFIAACSTGHVPLTAVQLLWVNSIMATSGVFALATDLGDLNHVLVTFIRGSCKLVLILVAVATLFGAAEAIAPEAASGERSIQAESSESDNANLIFGVIAAIGVFFSIIGVVTGSSLLLCSRRGGRRTLKLEMHLRLALKLEMRLCKCARCHAIEARRSEVHQIVDEVHQIVDEVHQIVEEVHQIVDEVVT